MIESPIIDSADEVVAKGIVARFIAGNLLPVKLAIEAQNFISSGHMKPEDWRLLAEKALEYQTIEARNEQQTTD